MKKLLIGLTILFSFILFLDNVNASVINGTYTINEDILNSDLYYNDFLTDYYGHTTYYDALIASEKMESFHETIINLGYKYYFYSNSDVYIWNDDDIVVGLHLGTDTGYSNLGYSLRETLYNPNNKTVVSYSYKDWINKNSLSPLNSTSNQIDITLGIHKYSSTSSTILNGFNTKAYSNNGLSYYHFPGINTNKDIIFTSSLPIGYGSTKNYYSSIVINGTKYNDGDIIYSLKKEPELKYKTGFTSSEAYSVLGKVSTNFKFIDNDFITEYKNYKFKLQFGSNDFTKENIPVFSHFKLYGRYNETDTWHSIDEYFNNNYVSLDVIDTTYDYSEGILADASITLQLNFNYTEEDFNILYDEFKIELYLDNTQNGYIYCYDNLTSSKWEDTSKFLEDYIYYYFPSNYKYAFITSDNNINEGKVYFPTNSAKNELIKLQGQYYNFNNKSYSYPIITNLYLNDTYYSYFDFYFNDNDNILLLNRAVGSYTYTSWWNSNFLESWGFLTGPLQWGTLTEISEDTYFYVPIGYKVYFTNDSNITVNTSNGNIDIDIENSNNNYENNIELEDTTTNSFFILFSKAFNYFISPIASFLSLITSFFEVLPLGMQYSFYVAFGFMIALLIYKFVL